MVEAHAMATNLVDKDLRGQNVLLLTSFLLRELLRYLRESCTMYLAHNIVCLNLGMWSFGLPSVSLSLATTDKLMDVLLPEVEGDVLCCQSSLMNMFMSSKYTYVYILFKLYINKFFELNVVP